MAADAERLEADARARAIGEALLARYRLAGERSMRGLPIYNAALDFAAVGFRAYQGAALGVVLTPWFMNLLRVPLDGAEALQPGSTVSHALPAGTFEFTVGVLDGFGSLEACSLFSPMADFADQPSALATAQAALNAVLDPTYGAATAAAPPPAAIDRRRFLRGGLSGTRP